jgi:hypothetical protein
MEEQPSVFKNSMNYGAMVGLLLIVVSFIFSLTGDMNSKLASWTSTTIYIAGIYLAIRHFRDVYNEGFINYNRAFTLGLLISIFASFIYAVYFYIFLEFVNQDFITQSLTETYNGLVEKNYSEEEIDKAMSMTSFLMKPSFFAIMAFFGNAFIGLLFTLAIGFMVKKEAPTENI